MMRTARRRTDCADVAVRLQPRPLPAAALERTSFVAFSSGVDLLRRAGKPGRREMIADQELCLVKTAGNGTVIWPSARPAVPVRLRLGRALRCRSEVSLMPVSRAGRLLIDVHGGLARGAP